MIRKIFALLFLLLFSNCSNNHSTNPNEIPSQFINKSKKFMVVTQGEHTTKIATQILKSGGNLVDAAVAASFAISVERPQSTGIGGGGFLIYYQKKHNKISVLDFRERAPSKSTKNMYLDDIGQVDAKKSLDGTLSVATPGLVAGLNEFFIKHKGLLKWSDLVKPAQKLAYDGFSLYPNLKMAMDMRSDVLAKFPSTKKIFFKNDELLTVGSTFKQVDLAKTLEQIAKTPLDFYRGQLAKTISNQIQKDGGILSDSDLKTYKVKYHQPVRFKFLDYELISMPPPSSGGVHIAQIIGLMDRFYTTNPKPDDIEFIHHLATSMQIAFSDRAKYLGDPAFVKVPDKKLISKNHLDWLFKKINNNAIKSEELLKSNHEFIEGNDTTHFTLANSDGDVIVSTQTLNYLFGSGYVVEGTGIIMNDEMDDFSTQVGASNIFGAIGSENNSIAPFKTPLSSMSPTIILNHDKSPALALGTPNGTRIITCVAQTILNYFYRKMSLDQAVMASRIHHQLRPEILYIGEPYPDNSIIEALKQKGHQVELKDFTCRIQAIGFNGDELFGVSDPRGEGMALGF